MRLRLMTLLTATLAASGIAQAQPIKGAYVGAGAGPRWPFATKFSTPAPGFSGVFNFNQGVGYDARLSVGYALGNGWRFELEGTLAAADIRGVSKLSFPTSTAGTVRNRGIMANALFDLDIGSPYIYPYLGIGVGYQSTRLDGFVVRRTDQPSSFTASGEAGTFAVQAIAGFAFPIPNMPGLSATIDYRLMDRLSGETFNGTASNPSLGPTLLPGGIKIHNQFDQSMIIGVRYAFNVPVPATEIPAAPAPTGGTHSYLVFFALSEVKLPDRAVPVVREAARLYANGQSTRIEVASNTGASDDASSSQILLQAKTVAAALMGNGVPKADISIQARGNTKPVGLTTPGGEARLRNRRVEIVIH